MNKPKQNKYYIDLIRKIETRKVNIGIIGIGYVGLPLALSFSSKGIKVIGFDINEEVIKTLKEGRSHINHVDSKEVERGIKSQSFLPTQDFSLVKNLDLILICLPTPLNKLREPDLSFITQTIKSIRGFLKKGQLISIESTTYPGATYEIIRPLIEFNDIQIGNNFFPNLIKYLIQIFNYFFLVNFLIVFYTILQKTKVATKLDQKNNFYYLFEH